MRRAWSVDEIYERIAQADGDIVHYGDALDQTPLIALRWRRDDARRVLLWGVPTGAEIATAPLAFDVAEWWREAGWEVWLVPALDPSGARFNESVLELDSLPQHVIASFRRAWAPGEAIEEWLPIAEQGFWQPAQADASASIDTRPESLGLWRLLNHCQPDVTVSLHEHAAGGAAIACTQGILADDVDRLLAVTRPSLPVHEGAKLVVGRQLAQQPNVIALPTLEDEADRAAHEEGHILVGGAAFWQVRSGLAWQLWLPRWTYDGVDDHAPVDQTRSVVYSGEQRERNGKLVPVQITTLDAPGHPAHGQEIRTVDLKKTESAAVGPMPDQPLLSGWLAVEAWYERQEALTAALETVDALRAHEDRPTYERASQVLRWGLHYEDHLLRSYLQNKRYGKLATENERLHWSVTYRLETISLVSEALTLVAESDQRDAVVERSVGSLKDLIEAQLPSVRLRPLSLDQRRRWVEAWSEWCIETLERDGFADARRLDRLERAHRQLGAAKRDARDAKNLKRPRVEQQQRAERVEQLQRLIKELEVPQTKIDSPRHKSEGESVVAPESGEAVMRNDEAATGKPRHSSEPSSESQRTPEPTPESQRAPEPPETETDGITGPNEPDWITDGRVRLSNRLRDELLAVGMNDNVIARFADRGIPLTMLDEFDIDPVEPRDESRARTTEPSSEESSESEEPSESAERLTEPSGDDALESVKNGKGPEEPSALPERVDMTPAIRARLEEEGLPLIILDRLNKEGIPRALVEHLQIEVAPATSLDKPSPATVIEVEQLGEEETDFDALLPPQLVLDPEWGRGPIRWEEQLPAAHELPFAALAERLAAGGHEVRPAVTELQDEETLEPVAPTVVATVIDINEGGFLRRRIELRPRLRSPIPHLPYPAPTGGFFSHRGRILSV